MADKTYLDWPFLDDSHRQLKRDLVAWCEEYTFHHADDVDDTCRQLVA
ncbi:MAG: acyl-CoA dehydrogenase, partial [Proteobacteria bacterium]|nr:acyl-CoA dehydrogenase [Pseudomonadota bacterium]